MAQLFKVKAENNKTYIISTSNKLCGKSGIYFGDVLINGQNCDKIMILGIGISCPNIFFVEQNSGKINYLENIKNYKDFIKNNYILYKFAKEIFSDKEEMEVWNKYNIFVPLKKNNIEHELLNCHNKIIHLEETINKVKKIAFQDFI